MVPHPGGRAPRYASRATERSLWLARWAGVALAGGEALLVPAGEPTWILPGLLAVGASLAVLNLAMIRPIARDAVTLRLAAGAFAIDATAIAAAVWLFRYDPSSPVWTLLVVACLEAAYRWEMRGAIVAAAGAGAFFPAVHLSASGTFGFPPQVDLIAFAVGLVVLSATVAGAMARRSRTQRSSLVRLHEAALALNRELDRGDVLSAAAREAASISGASFTVAWIPEGDGFKLAAAHGIRHDPADPPTVPATDPVFGWSSVGSAFAQGQPVVRPTVPGDDRSRPTLETAALRGRWETVVSVPVGAGRETVGVLSCYLARGRPDQEVIAHLQVLAGLTATSLSNADTLRTERSAVESLKALDSLKDDFLSTVSHELRTPLTLVEGFASTLLDRWSELTDDQRRDLVRRIDNHARELHAMIKDLLEFSRLQAGTARMQPVTFEISRLVSETLHRLGPSLGSRTTTNEVSPSLTWHADPISVATIFENLISNAARYSEPDSLVTVRGRDAGGWTEVSVLDRGIGVPSEERELIFNRFYRGSGPEARRVRGTGVGLAIVRELTEQQGGRVWVEDRSDGGSAFIVRLPAAEPRETAGQQDVAGSRS